MARVKIENGQLVISMKGARKILALKGELSVPISSVKGVTADPLLWKDTPFLKLYGTGLPGLLAGAFLQDGDKVFYDIKRSEEAVTIEIEDESFSKIIIGVDDPGATVKIIEESLSL
jgi:hypothetical protein